MGTESLDSGERESETGKEREPIKGSLVSRSQMECPSKRQEVGHFPSTPSLIG